MIEFDEKKKKNDVKVVTCIVDLAQFGQREFEDALALVAHAQARTPQLERSRAARRNS